MTGVRAACAAAALLALTGAAGASPTACPGNFLAGQAPDLVKPSLSRSARELCFSAYAVLHSGLTRTPLWSAEHLTRERVSLARGMDRVNNFHPDASLPATERAELSDYLRSGYDRGHMSPSGDMPDARSQDESFTLANMIPQNPDNNRHLWADIESAVRNLAARSGEVYVVTGPVFRGETLQSLKGRVAVPTDVYKAVYVPSTGLVGAYLAPNDASGSWRGVSLSELQGLTGIAVFPSLPEAARAAVPDLPQPGRRSRGNEVSASRPDASPAAPQATGQGAAGWIMHRLRSFIR